VPARAPLLNVLDALASNTPPKKSVVEGPAMVVDGRSASAYADVPASPTTPASKAAINEVLRKLFIG